jgi:CDP-diacylglycerol--glycerol-3-phosphate 3-phosphatidyltransferase/cardiolipin synthase
MSHIDEHVPSDARFLRLIRIIPNLLSLSRLIMAVAFPFIPDNWRIALVLAAAATDAIDGTLSRLIRATSMLGQVLDPIADKAFAMSVLGTLLYDGQLQLWHVALVTARDLAVIGGAIWLGTRHGIGSIRKMPPSWLGKGTTALQFMFILAVLYWQSVPWMALIPTALCSISAGIDYIRRYDMAPQ